MHCCPVRTLLLVGGADEFQSDSPLFCPVADYELDPVILNKPNLPRPCGINPTLGNWLDWSVVGGRWSSRAETSEVSLRLFSPPPPECLRTLGRIETNTGDSSRGAPSINICIGPPSPGPDNPPPPDDITQGCLLRLHKALSRATADIIQLFSPAEPCSPREQQTDLCGQKLLSTLRVPGPFCIDLLPTGIANSQKNGLPCALPLALEAIRFRPPYLEKAPGPGSPFIHHRPYNVWKKYAALLNPRLTWKSLGGSISRGESPSSSFCPDDGGQRRDTPEDVSAAVSHRHHTLI
ncbi:unnamed protein product [Pleuronectes platessa]|uniref:Uncharacterized protein n=1 Tax=Pleuronectes platessa TaxID=8262 RepID=A0A9N7YZ46_PLEPL|nr:unnamed protein product [Pleuronectes platessa]